METKERLLNEPRHLQQRIEALDRIEAYLLQLQPPPFVSGSQEAIVCHRATAIQTKLAAANLGVYAAIRNDIRQGHGRKSLLPWLPYLGRAKYIVEAEPEGYDYLDEVLVGVLQFEEPKAVIHYPTEEMVSYQPTPARHIFDLLDRTALTDKDVLVDIGSGLGHVPMLTSIWTSAHSVGIEVEPAYVDCARRTAESLNLRRVNFIQQDARAADFGSGTVFYLYTPFSGALLRAVLEALRREAANRTIRICTFGPCTAVIAAENWLDTVGRVRSERVSVFRSRPQHW